MGKKEVNIKVKMPYVYVACIDDKINCIHKVVGVFSTEEYARNSLKKYAHYDTKVLKKPFI